MFSVDDVETGTVKAGTGFWSRATFDTIAPGIANPWRSSTTNMAPFDQEFYLIMNLAIGGNVMFPDDATNAPGLFLRVYAVREDIIEVDSIFCSSL